MRSEVDIKIGWDLEAFSKSSQNLSRQLKKTGKQMQNVGKSMSTYLTAPIVAMGGLAVKTFADFEQSMAKVAAVSGATGQEFENLNKLAKDLGISTRFTASQVSELQLNYAKLGFSSTQIEKITEATLQLALATGEDLASSAETAGATLRGFGLEANEMQRVVDVMAKSFSSSALNLERFSTSMAALAPVAKNAGVSLEQATGYLSILVDRGVDASTAGTGLRNIFLDLAGSGMTLGEAMNQIATSTNKNKTAFDLFGKRGATVAAIMADNAEEADSLAKAYEGSAGAAADMAAIMDNTLQGSMFKLNSAVEGLGISFGEVLAPYVAKVAGFVSNLAIKFSNLSPETKKMILVVAGLAAAIGPLIFAVGSLTVALGFLAANPIVLIITGIIVAIGALVAAFIYVRANAQAFADKFYNIWVGIKNFFIDVIKGMAKPYLAFADLLGLDVGDNILQMLDGLKSKTRDTTKEFGTLKDAVKETVGSIKGDLGILGDKADEVGNKFEGLGTKVKSSLKGISEAIGTNLKSKTLEIPFTISTNVEQLKVEMIKVKTEAERIAEDIGTAMSDTLNNALQQLVTDTAVYIGEFLGNLASGGEMTTEDFGRGLLNMIGGFMKEFGSAMIAIGVAQAGINAAIASMNPALAIGAGIALVAAGSALSNLSKKGVDGSSSGGGSSTPTAGSTSMSGQDYSMSSTVEISGRSLILVQEREMAFRR